MTESLDRLYVIIDGDRALSSKDYFSMIAGASLTNLHFLITDLAHLDYNILFAGERGTGKELFADFYIQESQRKDKFEKTNCAGVEDEHLRSELFGHVAGAFTGAIGKKDGLFTKVDNGGGIFLDELGDATPRFQAAILRVLQGGDYFPLGSTDQKKLSNVKIIAATSKVDKLREDLRDRFQILYIPPLAKRKDDIPQIIKQTLWYMKPKKDAPIPKYISQNTLDGLTQHNWPGNVRELIKALELAILLSLQNRADTLRVDVFPTIPNLEKLPESDNSRKLKIQNLEGQSQPIPTKTFLIPPPATEAELSQNTENYGQTDLSITMDEILSTTSPKQYSNNFWEHYAAKEVRPSELSRMFKGKIAPSTASTHLNNAKKRLDQQPLD